MAGPRSEVHAAVQHATLARTGLTRDFAEGQLSSAPEVMMSGPLEKENG